MSGTTVDEVYLAQTGSHLKGHMLQGSASVSSSQNRVDAEDLQRAAQEAKRKQPEPRRTYVHHVRTPILLDGRMVQDPVGMIGSKVDLGYWSIDGDEQAIKQALHVIHNYSGGKRSNSFFYCILYNDGRSRSSESWYFGY